MRVRYNPPQRMIFRTRVLLVVAALTFLLPAAQAVNWEQPAAALARQIAGLTGPGPIKLLVSNRSSISAKQVPQIQQLLVQALHIYGVTAGNHDSPTIVSVTLSQNLQGGLWVAEVQEGTETRVNMLPVKLDIAPATVGGPTLTLQRTILITEPLPVLDAQVLSSRGSQYLVVLEPRQIEAYSRNTVSPPFSLAPPPWIKEQTIAIPYTGAFPRDLRGRIVAAQDHFFDAYLPGVLCRGTNNGAMIALTCAESDDPWPITATQSAFYDAARDYFSGVLVPGFGAQIAPFYEAAAIPRDGSAATLFNNVDGSVVLAQNNITDPVNGTEDWGSDLAAIQSKCGSGTQIVVSGSGQAAAGDNLRAYEIPGREAIPVSAPLPVPGVVTTIWPSSDGNSAMVVVHLPGTGGYEVWSVAANCN